MAITPKPLFQVVPGNALATKVYRPAADVTVRLESIIFLNRDSVSRNISIYHDIDGEVFDTSTLIELDKAVAAGLRYVFSEPLLLDENGALGILVETANIINVVGYGWVDE